MLMADLSIQNAFLDGLEEVYSIMFTDRLELRLLDEESTKPNVYEETPNKVYKPPIRLIGRVNTTFEHGDNPIESVQIDAVISIPTKQLITNNIPRLSEKDLETLRKAKFSYDGVEYLVEIVKPKTLVADMWQVYDFMCRVDKKSSLGGK